MARPTAAQARAHLDALVPTITSEAARLQHQGPAVVEQAVEVTQAPDLGPLVGTERAAGPAAYALPAVTNPLPGYTPEVGAIAVGDLADTLEALEAAVTVLDRNATLAGTLWADSGQAEPFVIAVERLEQLRKGLGEVAANLTRAAGRARVPHTGVLPDGRPFAIVRGAERKAWEHDEWQRDVRAKVLAGVGPCVNTATGEPVDVPSLVASAQAAHGAGAPKVTVLKQLGLTPGDYCETASGPWRIDLV